MEMESPYIYLQSKIYIPRKQKTIWMERDDGLRYRETQNHIPINLNTIQSNSGDENLISHITKLWTREIHTTQGIFIDFLFLSELVQIEWKHDNLSKEKEMCQKIYSKWQVIIIIFGSLECICARQWFRFFSYSNLS